jgi:hypothetical protein
MKVLATRENWKRDHPSIHAWHMRFASLLSGGGAESLSGSDELLHLLAAAGRKRSF